MTRGQISVGCFAMPLACGVFLLIMAVNSKFAVAHLLLESPCGTNKAYRKNLIGSAKTGMSRIECGLLCETNDACNSFTYNRRSGLCQLSAGMDKNCDLLPNEADSQYFTVVSNATPPVLLRDDMLTSSSLHHMGDVEQTWLRIKLISQIASHQWVIAYYSEIAYSKRTANGSDVIEYMWSYRKACLSDAVLLIEHRVQSLVYSWKILGYLFNFSKRVWFAISH